MRRTMPSLLFATCALAGCVGEWVPPEPPPFGPLTGPTTPYETFRRAVETADQKTVAALLSQDARAGGAGDEAALEALCTELRGRFRRDRARLVLRAFSDRLPHEALTQRAWFRLEFHPPPARGGAEVSSSEFRGEGEPPGGGRASLPASRGSAGASPSPSALRTPPSTPPAPPTVYTFATVLEDGVWRLDAVEPWDDAALDGPVAAARTLLEACRARRKYLIARVLTTEAFDALFGLLGEAPGESGRDFRALLDRLAALFPEQAPAPVLADRRGYRARVAVTVLRPGRDAPEMVEMPLVLDAAAGRWRMESIRWFADLRGR